MSPVNLPLALFLLSFKLLIQFLWFVLIEVFFSVFFALGNGLVVKFNRFPFDVWNPPVLQIQWSFSAKLNE